MSRPGHAFNRQELLRAIWGDSAYRDPRAIDVHIRHLREKLEEAPENPTLILTVPGRGTGSGSDEARRRLPRGLRPRLLLALLLTSAVTLGDRGHRAAEPAARPAARAERDEPARGRAGLARRAFEQALREQAETEFALQRAAEELRQRTDGRVLVIDPRAGRATCSTTRARARRSAAPQLDARCTPCARARPRPTSRATSSGSACGCSATRAAWPACSSSSGA